MGRRIVIIGFLTAIVFALALFLGLFFGLRTQPAPISQIYKRAAVATDAGKCSEIGR